LFSADDANPNSFRWDDGVLKACGEFRQGDVVSDLSIGYSAFAQTRITRPARGTDASNGDFIAIRGDLQYAMITTQTCDLAGDRGNRYPLFLAAPVYDIAGRVDRGQEGHIRGHRVGELIKLDGPLFVAKGGLWVADLRFETALEKGVLLHRTPMRAFSDEDGYLRCSRKIARVRARAAVDDNIEKYILRPLKKAFERGEIPHDPIIEILVKATPTTVKAKAARLYVLVADETEKRELQALLDDWHASISPAIPTELTLLGIEVREADRFTWLDYKGAEIVDFGYLSAENT
jgi:hypothetical protein